MITIRKAGERGHLNFGWLDAKHTFSFGSYYDPAHMGFRSLRVINNDVIAAGGGFDTHPHKDMEIITFILEGELEHRDTMGNHSVIRPGEIQIMSAGSGVYHSEHNPSQKDHTKLYQIWILPNEKGIEPRYEQYSYLERVKVNAFIDLATPEGGINIAKIYQDACLKVGHFEKDFATTVDLKEDKGYWIQVVSGELNIDDQPIKAEDGIQIESQTSMTLTFKKDSKLLFFEI